MTKFSLLNLKLDKNENNKGRTQANIFKAVKADNYGINVDNQAVFGLTLVPVADNYGYNPLSESINDTGIDADITYPEEGLIEGEEYSINEIDNYFEERYNYDTRLIITKVKKC